MGRLSKRCWTAASPCSTSTPSSLTVSATASRVVSKDDPRDALVLASSLRTDCHCFQRVEALDPAVVELGEWSRMAEELKGECIGLANRVRQQLWRYYRQVLDLTEDVGTDWALALWALP